MIRWHFIMYLYVRSNYADDGYKSFLIEQFGSLTRNMHKMFTEWGRAA